MERDATRQVRTSDDGETPECFGETDGAASFPEGLWRLGESGRLFGGMAASLALNRT
jgi:hypothetical protein